jgi:hypothetical protein
MHDFDWTIENNRVGEEYGPKYDGRFVVKVLDTGRPYSNPV